MLSQFYRTERAFFDALETSTIFSRSEKEKQQQQKAAAAEFDSQHQESRLGASLKRPPLQGLHQVYRQRQQIEREREAEINLAAPPPIAARTAQRNTTPDWEHR